MGIDCPLFGQMPILCAARMIINKCLLPTDFRIVCTSFGGCRFWYVCTQNAITKKGEIDLFICFRTHFPDPEIIMNPFKHLTHRCRYKLG